MVNARRNPEKKGRIWVERTLRGNRGRNPPSPKYWRVSARRMRAAGGPPGTQRSCIRGQSASNGCPPWGSYLEGLGQKRPFQPSTSSESVNQCTNTNVISHPAGTSGKAHLVSYPQKKLDPLGSVQAEVYCPTNTATPIP